MIIGIGIDVVHVYRLERWAEIPGLFQRFFHPDELEIALARGETGVLSLAARFAAKEAYGKALGTGRGGQVPGLGFGYLDRLLGSRGVIQAYLNRYHSARFYRNFRQTHLNTICTHTEQKKESDIEYKF